MIPTATELPSEANHFVCREAHHPRVEDLVEVLENSWDEDKVLQNLSARFLSGLPYTWMGNAIIAVNPCRDLADMYNRHTQLKYIRYHPTDLPAHIYATSSSSFWALREGIGTPCVNQTILLTGESGSGKTFTASLLLQHLVEAADMSRSVYSGTALSRWTMSSPTPNSGGNSDGGRARLLRSLVACWSLVFESFGHAEIPSNKSSSRFMAHTKVYYSEDASQILGVEANTLLLEVSRLFPGQGQAERTFHAFYQVLTADESIKRYLHLGDKSAADFALTSDPEPNGRHGNDIASNVAAHGGGADCAWKSGSAKYLQEGIPCDHSEGWGARELRGMATLQKVLEAMTTAGFEETEKDSLLRGLAAVLHITQIDFVHVHDEDIYRDFGVIKVGDELPLEAASDLLGCNKHHLRNALLTRSFAAGGEGSATFVSKGGSTRRTRGGVETLTVPLSKAEALRARDQLAQEVYLRLFRWLIKKMNACMGLPLGQERAATRSIGVVDTLGYVLQEASVNQEVKAYPFFVWSNALSPTPRLESLDSHGFEQLCKNYVIEKIRGKFFQDEVSFREGNVDAKARIDRAWPTGEAAAQVASSRQLLSMFEGPEGLIRLANDECLCPGGNGRSFTRKLLAAGGDSQQGLTQGAQQYRDLPATGENDPSVRVVDGADSGSGTGSTWPVYADRDSAQSSSAEHSSFVIRHFTGPVHYTAADLVQKNRGGIGQNLLDLLNEACSNDMVGERPGSSCYRGGRRASPTDGTAAHRRQHLHQRRLDESVLSQHQRQLTILLREIDGTKVRHILCVKPNIELSAATLDGKGLLRQLSTAGAAAAAQTAILSLPTGRRMNKEAFFKNFRIVPGAIEMVLNNDDDCCKLGYGIIFFRDGVLEWLEWRRKAVERRSCEVVQRVWRKHARRLRAKTKERESRISVEAEKRATAHRRQPELQNMQQAWEGDYCCSRANNALSQQIASRAPVFESSHANAVRETQSAHEATQAIAAAAATSAAASREEEGAWRLHHHASEYEASGLTTQAAWVTPDGAESGIDCSSSFHPPAVAHAWSVEDDTYGTNNDTVDDVSEAAPPTSSSFSALPACSVPHADPASQGSASSRASRRVIIPRLAGLKDYDMRAFLTTPVAQKYGMMRCRVTRWRERGGWNVLTPSAYSMHQVEEDGMEFMMSATRQPLSRTANYYISSCPVIEIVKDTEDFLGKLRARDGNGSSYTLFDHGISPARSSKDRRQGLFTREELARVLFTKTTTAADGPRSMEVFIPSPLEWRRASTVASCGEPADEGAFANSSPLERLCHRDGVVSMRDRKPRYDSNAGQYVLDFPDPTSKRSVKNVQLVLASYRAHQHRCDQRQEGRNRQVPSCGGTTGVACKTFDRYVAEGNNRPSWRRGWREKGGETHELGAEEVTLLSFAKSDRESFALDFQWPLTPMQAFGLALAALDTNV